MDEAVPPNCQTRIAERKPLLLVPVPGEAPWLQAQAQQAARKSLAGLPSATDSAVDGQQGAPVAPPSRLLP
jgi:hypothetical protein